MSVRSIAPLFVADAPAPVPASRKSPWPLAAVLAVAAMASGVLLTGISAWFLGTVALVGLGPAALAFNFHIPAALVRLFALSKTLGKYGEGDGQDIRKGALGL